MGDDALQALATRAGLLADWQNYEGEDRTVAPDTLRAVLAAMGLPANDDAAIRDGEARLSAAVSAPDFVTGTAGEPFRIDEPGPGRLILEDGSAHDVDPARVVVDLPGYHRLLVGDRSLTLAVAPRRAPSARDLTGRARCWGAAVQLYSLRGDGDTRTFGDFAALADFARAAGRAGADALAVSPAHALFAADPARYSPYSPSSRDFLNILYADAAGDEPAGDALIDWAAAAPARLARLRASFDAFEDDAAFDAFVAEQGKPLRRHALFEAIDAHRHALGEPSGWQNWPAAWHDPDAAIVADFARSHAREVRFHLWLQWQADAGLARAQAAARDAGMEIGLIADLAVGLDTGGSHAWSRRGELIAGLTIGAPPDGFQPDGQGWGITGFSPIALRTLGFEPYLRTLRTALRHAGGVRVDHALGLGRLWVIPDGADPTDGCYMRYPQDDMLQLLALEAHRSRAMIVGEDLGTVPDGFRDELGGRHLLGMSILSFERDGDGGFVDPAAWRPISAAMTTTHDLAPIAGWWRGTDLDWRERLGTEVETADEREADRARLWDRACTDGVAAGERPAADDPDRAVDAAIALVAVSACELAIVPAEDLIGLDQAPNLPGTIDQHPNWRRRYPADADTLFEAPAVAHRVSLLREHRP